MTPRHPHATLFPSDAERLFLYAFAKRLRASSPTFLNQADLRDLIQAATAAVSHVPDDAPLRQILASTVEAAFQDPWLALHRRTGPGQWHGGRLHLDQLTYESLQTSELLEFHDTLVEGSQARDSLAVEYDGSAFGNDFPPIDDPARIGHGIEFLNETLTQRSSANPDQWRTDLHQFLRLHQHKDRQLLLSQRLESLDEMRHAVREACAHLSRLPAETPWADLRQTMSSYGLLVGWGDTAGRILDTLHLLDQVLDQPTPSSIETFLDRLPIIFSAAIFSPHGYFGQSNVLGLPDTGGQIVYILDQVRALEEEMRRRLQQQGLDTDPQIVVVTRLIPDAADVGCDVREETIQGTRHARILRVPFTEADGQPLKPWISRFQVWPYLERFALDSITDILAELGTRPDLIIGNYSDGNLVATLVAEQLSVTQCHIAHALEKTKYPFSNLRWREQEAQYHFSAHFTADLLAMNSADFIITSTYQEIAGNGHCPGQYESYSAYTMPGLYRVPQGIDIHDPKFNIVSPGADEHVYFPHTQTSRRIRDLAADIDRLLHGSFPGAVSSFADSEKPTIFLMSRLDRVKNVTGFVECYAHSPELRELANVFIIGGCTRLEESDDEEEKSEIRKLRGLIDTHELDGLLRWVPKQSDKIFNGELYRSLADRRGVFVQPARFEAFGLTVIEAMTSGLPTFATIHGGPLEIIEDGLSGFHIDPHDGAATAQRLVDFFRRCQQDPTYWDQISQGGIDRVEARYTWRLYAKRLMTLSRVYGFWKYVSHLERSGARAYDRLFYSSVYRPIVDKMRKDDAL